MRNVQNHVRSLLYQILFFDLRTIQISCTYTVRSYTDPTRWNLSFGMKPKQIPKFIILNPRMRFSNERARLLLFDLRCSCYCNLNRWSLHILSFLRSTHDSRREFCNSSRPLWSSWRRHNMMLEVGCTPTQQHKRTNRNSRFHADTAQQTQQMNFSHLFRFRNRK